MTGACRVLSGLLAVAVLSACGFTGNLRMNPGFASFGTPSTLHGADRKLALSFGPIPIRLATLMSRPFLREEKWIPATLKDIRAVRVYSYELDSDPATIEEHLEATSDELIDEGWSRVAVVREDGGLVSALTRQEETTAIRGLVVMFNDEEQLVLVNVIGKLEPETVVFALEELGVEFPMFAFDAS
jgi:hypothetical protein